MKKALLLLLLSTLPILAQSTSLVGSVMDQAGAVIPDAVITVTNVGTAATRVAVSDAVGEYTISQLPPGMYTVEAQRTGFATYRTAEPLTLQVGTPLTLDIMMEVGNVSTTIDVVGDAVAINTENAEVGNPFTQTQVRQIPLQTRNVVDLLSIQPGVTQGGEVLGARADQNNVSLDGVNINDNQGANGFDVALPIPLDSVQEFRTTVAGQGADQGRSSGGQVSIVTKSGSNDFHGSVYEYNRNTAVSANTWFNNRAGIQRQNLIRNQYGISIGGPVMRDRAFFFFNWEDRKDRSAVSTTRTVPSASFRQGIVKVALNNGQIVSLNPAQVAAADPLGLGANQAMLNYLNSFPVGNDPTSSPDLGLNFDTLRFNAPQNLNNRAYVGKLDFNLDRDGNHTLSIRGTLAANSQVQQVAQFPGQAPASQLVNNSRGISAKYTAILSPNAVNSFTFGDTRIGTVSTGTSAPSLSFGALDNLYARPRFSQRINPTFNFADDFTLTHGRHTIQFGTNIRLIQNGITTLANSPSYSMSRNTLKGLGADISQSVLAEIQNLTGNSNVGLDNTLNVTNAMGALLGIVNSYSATYQFAISGNKIPFGNTVPRNYGTNEYEFYVQDSFRIRPDLMINLGLRYSNYSPVYETNGVELVPQTPLNAYFSQRSSGQYLGIPQNQMSDRLITYQPGGPYYGKPSWYNRDNNNFGPRASFAYSPTFDGIAGKLWGKGSVFRAGGAVMFDRYGSNMAVNIVNSGSPGLSTRITQPLNTDFTDSFRYTGGALPSLNAPADATFPYTPPIVHGGFTNYNAVDPSLRAPYQYVLDASFSRPLPGGLTLEVGYIGRLSHKGLLKMDFGQPLTNFTDPKSGINWTQMSASMYNVLLSGVTPAMVKANPSLVPLNPFVENIFPAAANFDIPGSASANWFYNVYGSYAGSALDGLHWYDRVQQSSLGGGCVSVYGCNTFFPLQSAGMQAYTNAGIASYNGMQVVLRKALANGISFDINYTLSHSIDNASASETSGNGAIQNSFAPKASKGPSSFDVRHIMTANTVFEVPYGRNKRWGNGINPFLNGIAGGWQISALMTIRSGQPVNLRNGGRYPTNYLSSALAILGPGQTLPATSVGFDQAGRPSLFRNTNDSSAFIGQYPGQTGTRGIIRNNMFKNVDIAIAKYFNMPWEGHRLQVRAEAFNAFNFVNFTGLQTNINSSRFGNYTGTTAPRVVQFALRYTY